MNPKSRFIVIAALVVPIGHTIVDYWTAKVQQVQQPVAAAVKRGRM